LIFILERELFLMRKNNFNVDEINKMNLTDFDLYYALVIKRLKQEADS